MDAGDTSGIAFGWSSLQGHRPRNEDFVAIRAGDPALLRDYGLVAVVTDGVGGHKGGAIAAELTARGFIEAYDGQNPLGGIRHAAAVALEAMNRWIHAIGRTDPALEGMASTVTALILRGRLAHVVHVGDSRLYRLRAGRITRLTTDHVSDRPGSRHVLTRAIGLSEQLSIQIAAEPLQAHDRFMLCTDGLHGVLSDPTLATLLAGGNPAQAATRLAEAALAARSRDNVSVAVIDVGTLPTLPGGELSDALQGALAGLPVVADPQVGREVDGFLLERCLSRGRNRVFVAEDRWGGLGRLVLKFPAGADAVARRMVLREDWIGLRVVSPWLAAAVALPPERRQSLYAVQFYYPGETLEQRSRRLPLLSLAAGLAVGIRLGKAVAALHRAGVIHRDIKPENVQLEATGGLRLLDLGIARVPVLDDVTGQGPAAGAPGTPSYMAPELLDGSQSGDVRSDLFALGVTLYRAWTGAYPYGEVEPFQRKRFARAVPLSTHRPDLPPWLGTVLAGAIALRPEDRPNDAIELVFALEHGAEALGSAPADPVPLLARDPARFWQLLSLLLALALLAAALSGADW